MNSWYWMNWPAGTLPCAFGEQGSLPTRWQPASGSGKTRPSAVVARIAGRDRGRGGSGAENEKDSHHGGSDDANGHESSRDESGTSWLLPAFANC